MALRSMVRVLPNGNGSLPDLERLADPVPTGRISVVPEKKGGFLFHYLVKSAKGRLCSGWLLFPHGKGFLFHYFVNSAEGCLYSGWLLFPLWFEKKYLPLALSVSFRVGCLPNPSLGALLGLDGRPADRLLLDDIAGWEGRPVDVLLPVWISSISIWDLHPRFPVLMLSHFFDKVDGPWLVG
ncbi:hypothetical protein Nepgr_018907 [Nepenthes gracilis]|uniref:Uncharacterized protein n=1 Tax=Nepenthes gracilis TaxID=150966 RepID=A0AAD3SUB8_NEPGR|nr:hypothetical protein Nepgr_018907 [Nepenthes gracilis]